MTQFYNMDGEPITREQAEYLLSRPRELFVAEDMIPPGILLTTHLMVRGESGPCACERPYLFETTLTDDARTIPPCRWHTKEEAIAGHRSLLQNVRVVPVDEEPVVLNLN